AAKQARKKVEAAQVLVKPPAPKTSRPKTVAGAKAASPKRANATGEKPAKSAKAGTPTHAKATAVRAARASKAASPPGSARNSEATPQLSAAQVAKSVIGRLAAAKRAKNTAPVDPGEGSGAAEGSDTLPTDTTGSPA
ncbi:MAG: hypothetical protein QOD56_2979, partial [Gammaproteobacteria bacterium]|nr:hypothetical protein [Gammaproteobacteria bacterium]